MPCSDQIINTMEDYIIQEQVMKVNHAILRLNAERQVLRGMLTEDVQSDMHYDGSDRAIKRHPKYKEAIEALSS